VKARGRQRTDATHVLAAVRQMSRLVCVAETMRCTLNGLAIAAPDWLMPHLNANPEWRERYGHRVDESRLPREPKQRQALAEQIGRDGQQLWQLLWGEHGACLAPDAVRQLSCVEVMRQIWVQQYWVNQDVLVWRESESLPAHAALLNSPFDLEARLAQKRTTVWVGYKVHLTETCDADRPQVITSVVTTPGTTNDCMATPDIHTGLNRRNLLPKEHLMDAGYVDSQTIVAGRDLHQIDVVGPVPSPPDWQAKAGQGFDIAHFTIDWEQQRVTCPQGQLSTKWSHAQDMRGNPIINARFSDVACRACAHHAHCTKSAGARNITFRPRLQHEALVAGRAYQLTPEFHERYKQRAGIEGAFSQADRNSGLRRSRYIGMAKTHLQHILVAMGQNIRRLFSWLQGEPLALTRIEPFVALYSSSAPAPA
jgi:transposase